METDPMGAAEELRETNPALSNRLSAFIEAHSAADLDAMMEILPKPESGQARKSIDRLMPNKGTVAHGDGVQNADVSVRFEKTAVTGGTQRAKLVGVVPSEVKGRNLQKIAESEKIDFRLLNFSASKNPSSEPQQRRWRVREMSHYSKTAAHPRSRH